MSARLAACLQHSVAAYSCAGRRGGEDHAWDTFEPLREVLASGERLIDLDQEPASPCLLAELQEKVRLDVGRLPILIWARPALINGLHGAHMPDGRQINSMWDMADAVLEILVLSLCGTWLRGKFCHLQYSIAELDFPHCEWIALDFPCSVWDDAMLDNALDGAQNTCFQRPQHRVAKAGLGAEQDDAWGDGERKRSMLAEGAPQHGGSPIVGTASSNSISASLGTAPAVSEAAAKEISLWSSYHNVFSM